MLATISHFLKLFRPINHIHVLNLAHGPQVWDLGVALSPGLGSEGRTSPTESWCSLSLQEKSNPEIVGYTTRGKVPVKTFLIC